MISAARREVRIAVIGAGFGGIATAIRLRQRAVRDFVVFDRATEIGGTWRDNSYPGCACDVPSQLYSLSFAPNPGWTRSFSGQAEIFAYLRDCVHRYDLSENLRLGHEVTAAGWDAASASWLIDTSGGDYRARVLVVAAGPLSEPTIPDLPGLADFTGRVFHSARWDHDYDLRGKRVAVIGTGASAVQFVPRIAGTVRRLHLFQRTPPWVLPRADRPIPALERRIYAAVPPAQRLARGAVDWGREMWATAFLRPALMRLGQSLARRHLRRAVPDPALRARLTPDYTMGCKRILLANDYYPALSRNNVEVVTDGIGTVGPDGVTTRDGVHRQVDAIIFGTGFRVTDMPVAERVTGRDGRSLAEAWRDGMHAYQGTSVAGFPNLFLLLGPNTGLGHTSVVFMIECQVTYLLGMLGHLDRTGGVALEPRPEAQRSYTGMIDRRMAGTVWQRGGCRSWYQDATGRNSTLWPGYTWQYWLRTRRFDPDAYRRVGPDRTALASDGGRR